MLVLILLLSFGITATAFSASEKEPYRHIVALGADRSFSNGDSSLGPIIAYYYFMEDFDNPDLYGQFTFKTTDAYFILGLKNEKFYAGIKPVLSYIWYGGYSSYYQGANDESRNFWGNSAGLEMFFKYNWFRNFSSKVSCRSDYRFYSKGGNDTVIDLPDNHMQNLIGVNLELKDVEEKSLGRIKHGYIAGFKYEYARRTGYGTFEDTAAVEDSSENNAHKMYFDLGAYYNFSGNYTLMFDVRGSLQYNVDRNNAEKIGYYDADHAVVPGYNAAEFYHNKYVTARLQLGIPVSFWDTRLQPGFNMLYMPEDNGVTGVGDYDKELYTSVSLGVSTMAGGVLPLFIDYGYGFNAERKGETGNHELRFMVLMAFGKN